MASAGATAVAAAVARTDRPLVRRPPNPALRACVVVPARDEAAGIGTTLRALLRQQAPDGTPLAPDSWEIILLANNCTDSTAATARRIARAYPGARLHVVERRIAAPHNHVGTARRWLMDEAARRLASVGRTADGLIVSTDADTRPQPTWLWWLMDEICAGADAVGGRILTEHSLEANAEPWVAHARRYHLRDVAYQLLTARLEATLDPDPTDPWPRHHQHFGANLAVTPRTYAAVGGLPALRCLEDVAFHRALCRADARVRHSPRALVVTSARQAGRVECGLSTQLRDWAAMSFADEPHLVECGTRLATRFRARYALRMLWCAHHRGARQLPGAALAAVADDLGIPVDWLAQELEISQPFGQLWEAVEQRQQDDGHWIDRWPLVDVREATRQLYQLVHGRQLWAWKAVA